MMWPHMLLQSLLLQGVLGLHVDPTFIFCCSEHGQHLWHTLHVTFMVAQVALQVCKLGTNSRV